MKQLLSPSNVTFNASAKTLTFTGTVPANIGSILHITNVTHGTLYFQPQAGPQYSGSYTAPVLTLYCTTAGHSNSDSLVIFYDDGISAAKENGNLATIAANTTNAGTPTVTGVVTANLGTIAGAATSALQTTGNSSLSSLDSKTPALVSGRQPVDGSGVTQPVTGTVGLSSGSAVIGKVGIDPATNTVQVSNFPATQPISAVALPLPTGAATSTKQDAIVTAINATTAAVVATGIGSNYSLETGGNLAAILTKLSSDPATQTTLAAVLAKITSDPATQTTLASVLAELVLILAKLPTTPALEGGNLSTIASKDFATQTTLAALLAKVTSDPATQTTLAAILTKLGTTLVVSGTVTANAGTNLNTSALALETGGNLATIAGKDFATQTTLAAILSKLNSSIAVTGTFWQATQPVSAVALPLPSGAATSANQVTQTTALDQLHTDLIAPLPAGTNAIGTVSVTNLPAVQSVSGTYYATPPTLADGQANALSLDSDGSLMVNVRDLTSIAATSANQVTQTTALGQLHTDLIAALPVGTNVIGKVGIDPAANTVQVSNLPISQKTMANSTPVTIASDQSPVSTVLTALNYPNSLYNNSVVQLASGASFVGGLETIQNLQAAQVQVVCDQPYSVTINQYIDAAGTQLTDSSIFNRPAGVPVGENITLPGNYFNIVVKNLGPVTTTTFVLNTTFGIMDTLPNSLSNLGNLTVAIQEVNGAAIQAAGMPVYDSSLNDALALIRRLVKLCEPLANVDTGGRQRVTVDSTINTLTTVTTVANMTSFLGIGQQQFTEPTRTAYNTGIRQNLTFS